MGFLKYLNLYQPCQLVLRPGPSFLMGLKTTKICTKQPKIKEGGKNRGRISTNSGSKMVDDDDDEITSVVFKKIFLKMQSDIILQVNL